MTMGEIVTTPKKKVVEKENNVNEVEYFKRLVNFVDTEITAGRMNEEEAKITLAYADDMFNRQGFVQGLPLWHRLFRPEEAADITRALGGVQTEARLNYETETQKILASDLSYDQKKGQISSALNKYATSAGLDQRAYQILSQQAETAAFSTLPKEEQTRLRAMPETAGAYQRGEIDVWGQPVKPPEGVPEYSRVFQEQVSGMQGPQPYKDWFASRYPSLMAGFTEKGGTKIQAEQAWTSYLSSASQRLQEEYARISPYQRGERPYAYAPPIRKVGFG